MDRDSTLLEEAYLKIAEMYYGYNSDSSYDREDPDDISVSEDLSFFLYEPFDIANKTYIVHFHCEGATASAKPYIERKSDVDYDYENKEILIWDVNKTPEIWSFFNEGKDKSFVDNLTDEIINAAIINYPDKNPDFMKKYKNHPLYGKIIKEIWEAADEIMWEKWKNYEN